jgi:hypothetical protein
MFCIFRRLQKQEFKMQINNYNYNKNQVSFGSKRIFPVVVRDMNDMPVKAWFSKLKLSDPVDMAALKRVDKEWQGQKGVLYADLSKTFKVYETCKPELSLYAIELDSSGNLYDKLLCFANMGKGYLNSLYLSVLQAAPNSSFTAGNNRKYKGAGTALMYGLVRTTKKNKAEMLTLCGDEAFDFYDKLGMIKRTVDPENPKMFTFLPDEMRNFIKRQKAEFKALSQKTT